MFNIVNACNSRGLSDGTNQSRISLGETTVFELIMYSMHSRNNIVALLFRNSPIVSQNLICVMDI